MMRGIEDTFEVMRFTVLGAITKGKTRAISILLSALVSPAPEIVHGAVCGLVEVGLAEARIVDGLNKSGRIGNEDIRHIVMDAISKLGTGASTSALPQLIEASGM